MSTALFGGSARSSSKNLVEFRAGKMYTKGQMVYPDKRKGLVYLYQADDSLMHFCWKDRGTGTVEEDLIIFPDDCEYKRVSQCTTGRVYVLKFKSSSRRLFFWMQEPKTDKDDEQSRKVNELLNNPPAPGSQRPSGSTANPALGSEITNLRDSDIQNLFGNISQQQLMQILGSGMSSLATLLGPGRSGSGGGRSGSGSSSSTSATTTASTTPAATTTPTPAPTPAQDSARGGSNSRESNSTTPGSGSVVPIQLSDLQNILSGISVPPDVSGSPRVAVDLSSAMTAEALQPILTNEDFVNQLRPYLPATSDELPPTEQLRGTVTSPQFQQAVSLFSSALQSGQLGPLINQFGLGEDAVLAASSCDMEAFIKALGKKKGKEEGSKKEEEKEVSDKTKDQDKDDDDAMSVD
ncbi:proteasomal ubiquitin receptor ADRM1-like isoform X1 [Procambarus clarkii]|uniref:proteasomal ubiquitin receptor ADRM1-like isoform X1 n=2 Tax=Procambarus clarkii TaxID=6728 RepID=UPI001E6719D2|nr:proteasomal ubiquitin receptor ADRM1-like isoform X1 [Procambarus clarkii]XP_045584052.1 proteasomal ubiquitin receptor ADRM1-like isoform X2 [Procambarus clarkii]